MSDQKTGEAIFYGDPTRMPMRETTEREQADEENAIQTAVRIMPNSYLVDECARAILEALRAEREACASLCESMVATWEGNISQRVSFYASRRFIYASPVLRKRVEATRCSNIGAKLGAISARAKEGAGILYPKGPH